MNISNGFLNNVFQLGTGKTRSICAENPKGEKGQGGMAANHLGIGRKGRPCIDLPLGESELANIEGTGIIQHIWITMPSTLNECKGDDKFPLRNIILKIYWDNEETPSVESPVGDFFCNGFAQTKRINSIPICSNPTGGFNCYFPMPFRKHARIVVDNQQGSPILGFFFQITYSLEESIPQDAAYFHAFFNRTEHIEKGKDHVLVDNIKGRGHYVGTYIALSALSRNWWGEGEMKFFMDGDTDFPTICGTGTEDYVGGAWCFYGEPGGIPESYCTPFLGYVYYKESNKIDPWYGHNAAQHGMYRFHLPDPIRFESSLRVTLQDIGHNSKELYERDDDISTVAYWYQTEPHNTFPAALTKDERRPR